MVKARNVLKLVKANPGLALGVLMVVGSQVLAQAANPLSAPMTRIQNIICGIVDAVTGPFGAALAIIMLALGFGGLIIGNRNSMGLIITAIAGGALLLAAKTLGNTILGATGCA
ncbi:TrbC/VirB2 family protein [Thermus scotoductus]|uniref:TrbC/VirB2 family protein n=1 Tax=Thermus scotoductus TaxID=37636 RepID=UPI00036DD777|nr:TrbC/VirB2 family protein [Thermus scotoductus]